MVAVPALVWQSWRRSTAEQTKRPDVQHGVDSVEQLPKTAVTKRVATMMSVVRRVHVLSIPSWTHVH